MTIVTISRGSYSMGKAVAEEVAKRLNFACISRDVLLEASAQFNRPEVQLHHAISDAPSFLDRITHGRQKYIAFIQSALVRHVCQDNIVYHGLGGHLLLKDISHVLKVRIVADLEVRAQVVMKRDQITHAEAVKLIHKLDQDRHKWTRTLYGVEPWDASLYDLQLNVPRYKVADAAQIICQSVEMNAFKTTAESRQAIQDLALACQVKAALADDFPLISVTCHYGNVVVYGVSGDRQARKLRSGIDAIRPAIDGIHNIEAHADVAPPAGAV